MLRAEHLFLHHLFIWIIKSIFVEDSFSLDVGVI